MKASEVQEHGRVNEALSNAVTLTTVGKAKEVLQTKAEEAIKAEEARKAEEEARRAEEAASLPRRTEGNGSFWHLSFSVKSRRQSVL